MAGLAETDLTAASDETLVELIRQQDRNAEGVLLPGIFPWSIKSLIDIVGFSILMIWHRRAVSAFWMPSQASTPKRMLLFAPMHQSVSATGC